MISGKPRAFMKRPSWDIFSTYSDSPRSQQANIEMKALCDKFVMDFNRVSNKYTKEGLSDSASREMVLRYILEKIEPWRKKRRLMTEQAMMSKFKSRK